MKPYKTIHKEGTDTYIISKSKFISNAIPINSEEEAIAYIEKMRSTFSDATHNVYAYVYGENNSVQRYSDDGEPSGTAGIPVLNVLKQEDLRNICLVVTRYFGGVKLGSGGLIRAYGKSAKLAIENALVVEKLPYTSVIVTTSYPLLGKIENSIQSSPYDIIDKEFTDIVKLTILSPDEELDNLHTFINNLTDGSADIEVHDTEMYSTIDKKIIE